MALLLCSVDTVWRMSLFLVFQAIAYSHLPVHHPQQCCCLHFSYWRDFCSFRQTDFKFSTFCLERVRALYNHIKETVFGFRLAVWLRRDTWYITAFSRLEAGNLFLKQILCVESIYSGIFFLLFYVWLSVQLYVYEWNKLLDEFKFQLFEFLNCTICIVKSIS